MAKSSNSGLFKHPYYTILIAVALLIGLGLLVNAVLGTTVIDQHASVDQFTAIAVKGSIYVDKNRNGKRDAGEVNYTGDPKPKVKLVLFNSSCEPTPSVPTPSVRPSLTPIPPTGVVSPTPTCFVRKFCPMGILCRAGDDKKPSWCPPCKEQTVCITGEPVGDNKGQPIVISGEPIKLTTTPEASMKPSEPPVTGTQDNDQDKQTAQNEDVCRRSPVRVINCPVSPDGTYTCTAVNTIFTQGWVKIYAPARFITTSTNPVSVKGPTATVDFGIASFFQPLPLEPVGR